EILLQIVIQGIDDAADMRVPLADVDGVAVGRRTRDAPDRDAAAGTANVLDDDRLTQQRPHLLGHDARGDIGRAARRERYDEGDLTRRVGLRLRAGDAGNTGKHRQRDRNDDLHILPLYGFRIADLLGC